jgi:hypothetical protein
MLQFGLSTFRIVTLRAGMLVLGAMALASCTTSGGLRVSAEPTELPPEKALAFPAPGGPGIVSVIERNFSNAIQQDILLETRAVNRGQNYIQVRYFGPASKAFEGSSRLPTRMMTMGDAVGVMRSEFPSIRMSISANFTQNNYGAFSYAYGTSAGSGDACLFGWQQIKAPDNYVRTFRYLGTIQTRVRICETGASRDQLLAQMYHFSLTGAYDSIGWNPYAVMAGPDPVIGQLGRPVYAAGPSTGAGLQTSSPPVTPMIIPQAAPRTVVRRQAPRANRAPAAPIRPSVPAVAIPAPTMSGIPAPVSDEVSSAPMGTGLAAGLPTGLQETSARPLPSQVSSNLYPTRTSRYGSPSSIPSPDLAAATSSASLGASQPTIPAVPCTISPTSICDKGL